MEVKIRSLGEVIDIVKEMGLEVTHAYDDLAFISHNSFLVQIPETGGEKLFKLFFNKECLESAIGGIVGEFSELAKKRGFRTEHAGRFEMTQKDDDQLELKFY
jgi:hypothetical protein